MKALAEPRGQRWALTGPHLCPSICLLWVHLAQALRMMKGKLPEAAEVRPH